MTKQIYFIAIIPPVAICDQITGLRNQLLSGFNLKSESKKFSHITLQHTFRKEPAIENELNGYLSAIAKELNPFSVTAKDFGHFDNRILYISVENNQTLQYLFDLIHHLLLEKLLFTDREISQSFKPHITLEKKLTPELFSHGWSAIQNHPYNTSFIVENISLLKHNGIRWEPFQNFKLGA